MIQIIQDIDTFISNVHSGNQLWEQPDLLKQLQSIQSDIKKNGDEAVKRYTKKFDHIDQKSTPLWASEEEIKESYNEVSESYIEAIKKLIKNVENYHKNQKPNNWNNSPKKGVTYGRQYSPINRVCLYVPGGQAVYPTSVVMNAIPANIAQVPHICIVTPPQADNKIAPQILVAADCCNIKSILKVGGAQAVFAVANGTQTIPKVDKIVGPGNRYVAGAKQMIYGSIDIDKPAGPSEVLVYCNQIKYAPYAAAELLAQLEHDPENVGIGISEDPEILQTIQTELSQQIKASNRQDIIRKSCQRSALFHTHTQSESIEIINKVATEHLALICDDYNALLPQINNAGAIFCGPYTSVTLGDYYAGPNHVLPTAGAARFASPLNVMDFMKFSSTLHCTESALKEAASTIETLTQMEGLDAHYLAIKKRIEP